MNSSLARAADKLTFPAIRDKPPGAEPRLGPAKPLPSGVAERAIEAFERMQTLNVTIHDLEGRLSPFIRPDRFHHRSPLCAAVKAQGRVAACMAFDVERVQREIVNLPEGRVQVCHAGLVECVVPVFIARKLSWVMFAGPRLPARTLTGALRTTAVSWAKNPWQGSGTVPLEVDDGEAELILEHLRQLAARLKAWIEEVQAHPSRQAPADAFLASSLTKRQVRILRFIEDTYAEPVTLGMLAKALWLSESRTSHVVQEACNATFRELVVQKRLRVAMSLLRESGMSVLQVALASGFETVAHFHRTFRRRIGMTPAQYRTRGG